MKLSFGKKKLRQRIVDHLGAEPFDFPIISERFPKYNHANVFLALKECTQNHGRTATIIGVQSGGFMNFSGVTLSDIVAKGSIASNVGFSGAKEGPVQYTNLKLDGGKTLACMQSGLLLVDAAGEKLVVQLRQQQMDFAGGAGIFVEVMAKNLASAETFMKELKAGINKLNIYRGKVLLVSETDGKMDVNFHALSSVEREQIVLPADLLQRIERQTLGAAQYSEVLLKAGRKLKRGILLYGSPGTGKTLTAMYLATQMKGRTVLTVTGRSVGLIEVCCDLARWLQPSMLVLEDVDLIAEERTKQQACENALLFELLNQMDGLSSDTDVLFLLTTNRPDILEPALASRPGRVDQAFEIPLPDSECRERLFDLYSKGLTMDVQDMASVIRRTEGASGAFINEVLRKAALFAAPHGEPLTVKDEHIDEALHELIFVGGAVTRHILGFQDADLREPVTPDRIRALE